MTYFIAHIRLENSFYIRKKILSALSVNWITFLNDNVSFQSSRETLLYDDTGSFIWSLRIGNPLLNGISGHFFRNLLKNRMEKSLKITLYFNSI